MKNNKKIAVIDVGSNSVRYALTDEKTAFAKKELNSTVLADGLFFSGALSPEAIRRTVDAVALFCDKAKQENADGIYVFATEAVRAARNGKEFTDAVLARTGITVDVLSGAEEARIGFFGALPVPRDRVAVFDMGGASCEIICGENGRISFLKSCPIGCVRLRDGANGNRDRAQALILSAFPTALPQVDELVGIGGTATALGGMLRCPQNYDPALVHGAQVDATFLQNVIGDFFDGKDLRACYPSLSPARARIIGYGALAALILLQRFSLPSFTVSERDNMEGYAQTRLPHV